MGLWLHGGTLLIMEYCVLPYTIYYIRSYMIYVVLVTTYIQVNTMKYEPHNTVSYIAIAIL